MMEVFAFVLGIMVGAASMVLFQQYNRDVFGGSR